VQTDGGCDSRTEGEEESRREEEESRREEETGSPLWSSLSRILQCDGGEDSDSETDLGMLTRIRIRLQIVHNRENNGFFPFSKYGTAKFSTETYPVI
jgi:hypothetical protein